MKKILIILLMILSLSLVACSNKYEKIYNLDNEIELVEVFNEEQAREYIEEFDNVLKTLNYITYKGYEYCTDTSLLDPKYEASYITNKVIAKFQRKAEIRFVFKLSGTEEKNNEFKKTKYEFYGKDGNIYYNFGEYKSYICNQYYDATEMRYFNGETILGALNAYYNARYTYGIDKEGNFISYAKMKLVDNQDSIHIVVYNNYKVVYAEWRRMLDGETFYCVKENFSYNNFFEIKKDLSSYEHRDYDCCF